MKLSTHNKVIITVVKAKETDMNVNLTVRKDMMTLNLDTRMADTKNVIIEIMRNVLIVSLVQLIYLNNCLAKLTIKICYLTH